MTPYVSEKRPGSFWSTTTSSQVETMPAPVRPRSRSSSWAKAEIAWLSCSRAPLIEEVPHRSRWAPLGHGDSYPTLPIALVSGTGSTIEADLDTGSHATWFNAAYLTDEPPTWFEGRHLGQAFLW